MTHTENGGITASTETELIFKSREHLKLMLDKMRIDYIIYVDDAFTSERERLSSSKILAKLQSNPAIALPELFQAFGNNAFELDVVQISEVIKDCSETEYEKLIEEAGLSEEIEENITTDNATREALEVLFKDIREIHFYSPQLWLDNLESTLAEEDRILVFMDLDLTRSGISADGSQLIATAMQKDTKRQLQFALLTHTTNEDKEEEKFEELRNSLAEQSVLFVVIAKNTAINNSDNFVKRVGLGLITNWIRDFVGLAKSIIQSGYENSMKFLRKLNIKDLDHIIFKTTEIEGAFEVDAIFRLYSIISRSEIKLAAYTSPEIKELLKQTKTVRQFSLDKYTPTTQTREIQRQEYYENPRYLNNHFRPIDLGDIFEETSTGKLFILLNAQCDIPIRRNGARHVDIKCLHLAEILSFDSAKIMKFTEKGKDVKHLKFPDQFYKLKYFNETMDYYVNLKSLYSIEADILDLCAYSIEGAGITNIHIESLDLLPDNLKTRASSLKTFYHSYKMEQEKYIAQGIPSEVLERLLPFAHSPIFKPVFREGNIVFDIKRVGRLLHPYVGELLLKYSAYKSRMGFEVDFG